MFIRLIVKSFYVLNFKIGSPNILKDVENIVPKFNKKRMCVKEEEGN